MTDEKEKDPIFGEVIFSYTREMALADGVLIDVTALAREAHHPAGIQVVFTESLHNKCADVSENPGESWDGRAYDVLWMAFLNLCKRNRRKGLGDIAGAENPEFQVIFGLGYDNATTDTLWCVADAEGVTIGYPEDF